MPFGASRDDFEELAPEQSEELERAVEVEDYGFQREEAARQSLRLWEGRAATGAATDVLCLAWENNSKVQTRPSSAMLLCCHAAVLPRCRAAMLPRCHAALRRAALPPIVVRWHRECADGLCAQGCRLKEELRFVLAGMDLVHCSGGATMLERVAQPDTGVVGVRVSVKLSPGERAAVVVTATSNAVPGENDWAVEREIMLSHPPPLLGP